MFHTVAVAMKVAVSGAAIVRAAKVLQVPSNVTVNGKSLTEYIDEERTREINRFFTQEVRGVRRTLYR